MCKHKRGKDIVYPEEHIIWKHRNQSDRQKKRQTWEREICFILTENACYTAKQKQTYLEIVLFKKIYFCLFQKVI